ncbi:MAG: penicillin-binding protein 2 [Epulopiscium sp.]|nr:penicillin-binding protein 2 [Candidatus Epulonipiscium sp.]
MSNMKKSMKRIFWMIALMFFLLMGMMIKLVLFDREEISSSAYNPRLNYIDNSVRRGEIRDINEQVLAQSILNEDGTYTRKYLRSRMAAHITGYSSMSKTGIEASENFELQRAHHEIWQRIKGIVTGEEIQGNHVVLTVDMDVQSVAGNLLGDMKGAIVAIEPSTGRILALQAYPDFDPNKVKDQWERLKEDEDSPLVNRATQGLYPPGSTFKIVTALAGMDYVKNWQDFTYDCTGEATYYNKVIHCYNNKAHGSVDMRQALAVSCNCYFAELSTRIGAINLRKTADALNFNQRYGFSLAYNPSKMVLNENSTESALVETAIGQGQTLVTPLHMAMLAAAVANDGMMMKPYLVDHIEYYNGKISKTTVPEKLRQVMSPEDAQMLKSMMTEVVSSGTGTAAQISGVTVAGKTGTAENATGKDHSWFIGFAPAENPKVAVAVMLENADLGAKATPIAGKVIKSILDKYGN